MTTFEIGQEIMTGTLDQDDHAAVGDIRKVVDWATKIVLASYRVTEVNDRGDIKGEVIEGMA